MQSLFFVLFSLVTIFSAISVVRSRNLVHSILWLVVVFFSTACIFVLLKAEFLAAMQILVYAGAIVILYVFAVMLVNLKTSPEEVQFHRRNGLSLALGGVILAEVGFVVASQIKPLVPQKNLADAVLQFGGAGGGLTKALGQLMYTEYVFPFEVASIILLVAIIGAVVLVGRRS